MSVDIAVGCAVWDRAWSLDVWFDSLLENVKPERTALAFVVYAEDQRTREIIANRSEDFAKVEIMRHRGQQFSRKQLEAEEYASLAQSRNALLSVAIKLKPVWYVSWDPNIVVAPGTLSKAISLKKPAATVWCWLNRQAPKRMMYGGTEVEFQEPMNSTVLSWRNKQRTGHLPGGEWDEYTGSNWKVQAFQQWALLHRSAYTTCSFGPHPDGEFTKLSQDLAQRGFERWCCADETAVSIQSYEEAELGLQKLLLLAGQKPLAAQRTDPQDDELQTLGLYPTGERQ